MQHFSTMEEEGANCLMPPEILAFLKIEDCLLSRHIYYAFYVDIYLGLKLTVVF